MKRILVFTALFLSAYVAIAQQPPAQPQGQTVTPKAPYDSTKAQLSVTKEENIQLKANATLTASQQQMKDFQAQYLAEETALTAWIVDVKKSNAWDDSYTYDRVGDKWTRTPNAVTKPAEAPKK